MTKMKAALSSLVFVLGFSAYANDQVALDLVPAEELEFLINEADMEIMRGGVDVGVDIGVGRGRDRDRDRRQVTCYAQNARRQMFRASGTNTRFVQQRALMQCERVSAYCQPMGCRATRF